MKPQIKPKSLASAGFALVVTLSLMILLALLAVGLLGLSGISLRAGATANALAEARSNARLAMILAIGELQKQAGPDQRVTAAGGIVAATTNNRHWTGVWDSWQAGPTASGGDPPSEHATLSSSRNRGMSPTYVAYRSDHFRRWLVSLPPVPARDVESPSSITLQGSVSPPPEATGVKLVSAGSLGVDSAVHHVTAGLANIADTHHTRGRFGWWVGDESTKARILHDGPHAEGTPSIAARVFHHQAPANTGFNRLAGLEKVADSDALAIAFSRSSLALLEGADRTGIAGGFHDVSPYSFGLLCDVREGGMKRDLSALLERPINTRDSNDSFMIYRFGSNREQVPIQDLAAYYQLYRSQVQYSSRELHGGLQIKNPDFGTGGTAFTREYTNLYRLPVPIKVQFLLSLVSEPRTTAEKNANRQNTDTHKLNIGITPAITLWNPYNLPLVMNQGANFATQFRFFNLPLAIRWTKTGAKNYTTTTPTSLAWIANGASAGDRDTGFTAYFSGTRSIIFEPGQVRVFSLANTSLKELKNSDTFVADREVVAGWDPDKYIKLKRSDRSNNALNIEPPTGAGTGALTFSAGDRLSFTIEPTETVDLANGSALQFFNRQSSVGGAHQWMGRQFQLISRMSGAKTSFNRELMALSFPDGRAKLEFEPRPCREIMAGPVPFLLVNLAAGCETSEDSNSGPFAGRHLPSRPFLHSSPVTGTVFIDRADKDALYQNGWNWWVEDINSPFDANISIDRDNNGYYGGGYTAESGTTHVVQQEIPVAPPIAIAALSHAQLGGFSLANAYLGPGASETITNFQETTASGQGGLFPQTVQAIGNSYAHPHLAPHQAYGTWTRNFTENAPPKTVTFADHSYLANKALWDDYFFSSISPGITQAFSGGAGGTAKDAAKRFFFHDTPLPNPRMTPCAEGFTEEQLDGFFDGDLTNSKGADRIASKLLVKGPFNINSTSVGAWRALFSSLRGNTVAYLDAKSSLGGRGPLGESQVTGSPVAQFSLPNGRPLEGGGSNPAEPGQWLGWRELSDLEIDELAEAMVRQVRLRGPFLSLSEFINRRLDQNNPELALNGALQAALDDPMVSINKGFRTSDRSLNASQTRGMRPAFPMALEGPVAYGSTAYIDQADILRGLAGQLTPRGDTFLIRAYGDSLDASGAVRARAWCEAVVQRLPGYLDPEDEAQLKQAALTSTTNRLFGRQLRIISFRFLNAGEV